MGSLYHSPDTFFSAYIHHSIFITMRGLPFKVKPQINTVPVGNDRTGIVDFTKLGDLTVGERYQLDQIQLESTEAWSQVQEMATRIHKTEGISEEMAFNVVSSNEWVDEQEAKIEKYKKEERSQSDIEAIQAEIERFKQIKAKYIWDILRMSRAINIGNKQQEAAIATIFINSRTRPDRTVPPDKANQIIALVTSYLTKADVDKSIVFGLKEKLIEETEGWTEGDTKQLTTEMLSEILTFYREEAKVDEEEGGEDTDPDPTPTPSPNETSPEENPEDPQTGEKSTGESENTGRTTKGSTKKTLATVP